jgi:sugar/nucleoside kinase (ribokinase family)
MKPRFDLISIGDTTEDIFMELKQQTKVLKDKDGTEYLGVAFAEKIAVEKVTDVLAVGNAANVAVGSSRLGLKTALYTMLGDDDTGEQMAKVLVREGVSKDYIVFDKNKKSNLSVVLNYKAERTILVHHEKRNYALPKLAGASWLYFTSLGQGHENLHSQIPLYIKGHGAKLAFNPGSHQLSEGLKKLKPVLKATTVLFLNREESQSLVGKHKNIKVLLARLRELGPDIAVITDGPKGSFASNGIHSYFLSIFPAPLVERTGAGDGYGTGFVAALAQGKLLPEAMRWGTLNSASVIGKIGAREGLLSKKTMEQMLQVNSRFQPKII